MIKKIKSITKSVKKKTVVFIKKANKQVGRVAKSVQKEYIKEKPKRKKYKEEVKVAVSELFKNGIKVGSDIVKTIEKDISEINNKNN